jgi:two-component system chemotaxis sensor kinase CheA
MSVSEDEEILLAFCEESRDNLHQMDRDLVELETRGADQELLSRVFRAVHTLKGTCGFLGFTRLEALAHAGEDLLSALREGELVIDASSATSLLRLVDVARTVLIEIEATSLESSTDHGPLIAELRSHLGASVEPVEPVEPAAPVTPAAMDTSAEHEAPSEPHVSTTGDSTVRVDVAVLDRLMDVVGELVLARGRIGELVALDDNGPFAAPYRDLRVLTGDLQDSVLTARLQPIGTVTGKVPRIARDLSAALGKQVAVHIEGEAVGVDKAVNEALRDPLLHLVRNCLDHGIESPAERIASGKSPVGRLSIRAFHQGGRVHLEVADDGQGVNLAALKARAVTQNVLSAEAVHGLTEAQALDLMFHPGLTTRDEVTSTSGRGVGMDVVRSSIEQVGGSVHVNSSPGRGVVFRLNVPLTLAIMPVLVAWCGGDRYAIPQVHLLEVMRLDSRQVDTRVDAVGEARMLRLRGRLLPLVELNEHLGVASLRTDGLVVVVVETDGRRFGLVVDGVADTVDAVVKPLPALLRSLAVFAGTTILADGRPALVVDVPGVAGAAGISSVSVPVLDGSSATPDGSQPANLLLATAPDGGMVAFPLAQVRRLESFAVEQLERSGGATVVQYGEELLTVVRIGEVLPERRRIDRGGTVEPAPTTLETVVCESSSGTVGLVVASIDDVVDEPQLLRQPASRDGVTACLVVEGRVAELLDVDVLSERARSGRWHAVDDRLG